MTVSLEFRVLAKSPWDAWRCFRQLASMNRRTAGAFPLPLGRGPGPCPETLSPGAVERASTQIGG